MLTYVMLRCGLCLMVSLTCARANSQTPGVLDKIKTGLEYASSYIETAKDIADLVSQSLGHRNKKHDVDYSDNRTDEVFGKEKRHFGPQGLVAAFFKLLGLDPPKINAIAVNSAIFLAQMISTAFGLKSQIEQSRSLDLDPENKEESEAETEPGEKENWAQGPLQLILGSKNERVERLLRQARNADLPTHLIERLDGLDTACIRLLVCKTSPVIWAAQKSLVRKTARAKWDVTSWLPSVEEFEENGDKCEKNHDACRLFPES